MSGSVWLRTTQDHCRIQTNSRLWRIRHFVYQRRIRARKTRFCTGDTVLRGMFNGVQGKFSCEDASLHQRRRMTRQVRWTLDGTAGMDWMFTPDGDPEKIFVVEGVIADVHLPDVRLLAGNDHRHDPNSNTTYRVAGVFDLGMSARGIQRAIIAIGCTGQCNL